jgi:uncharacterized protein
MNKLCEENRDFKKFLKDVKIDFDGYIHRSEYDSILPDAAKYIRDKMKIEQSTGVYR